MAVQLVADLYECSDILDDLGALVDAAHKAIDFVGANIVEECVHKFEPIGITYFAVITTSHFSIHTWPENRYAAVDIFSCSDEVVEGISETLKKLFEAKEIKLQLIERDIIKKN